MGRNIKNRTQKVVNTVTKPVEKLLDKLNMNHRLMCC